MEITSIRLLFIEGDMKCSFESGLVDDCSDIRVHDAYQRSYKDVSWTESPWEVTIRQLHIIPNIVLSECVIHYKWCFRSLPQCLLLDRCQHRRQLVAGFISSQYDRQR